MKRVLMPIGRLAIKGKLNFISGYFEVILLMFQISDTLFTVTVLLRKMNLITNLNSKLSSYLTKEMTLGLNPFSLI